MGIYKRLDKSPYWLYTFKLPGQKQICGSTKIPVYLTEFDNRESAANRKAAEAEYERLKEERKTGIKLNIPKKILLNDLFERYFSTKSKKGGDRGKQRLLVVELLRHFGHRYASEITTNSIDLYRTLRLNQKINKANEFGDIGEVAVAPGSVNREMCVLSSAFNEGIKWGLVSSNPFKGLSMYPVESRIRSLSDAEKSVLFKTLEPHPMLKKLALFAMWTGMRQGEIIGLKWPVVDLVNKEISLLNTRTTRTKNGKNRFVPIPPEVEQILSSIKGQSEYVFSTEGRRITQRGLNSSWKRYILKSGIQNFRFHDLRHTYATDFLRRGGSIQVLQILLGHSDISQTMKYAHTEKSFITKQVFGMPSQDYGNFMGMEIEENRNSDENVANQ